ncbi:hypothetical protein POUND7_004450 [Theobroma cacao]
MQYVKCLNFFQDLLKAKALERGRLLGLDVGDKYVGLAVSDLDNKIATPLSVLIRKKTNIDLMASDFQSLGRTFRVEEVDRRGNLVFVFLDYGITWEYVSLFIFLLLSFCEVGVADVGSSNLACFLFAKYITDVLTEHLISELSLVGFIVGYPFDRQQRAPDAVQVKLFIDDLSKTGKLDGVKYTFWNECFTSKQYMTSSKESHSLSFQQNADLLLKPLSLHPILSKTIVDKFAAVQILQTYLDYGKKNVKLETAG